MQKLGMRYVRGPPLNAWRELELPGRRAGSAKHLLRRLARACRSPEVPHPCPWRRREQG